MSYYQLILIPLWPVLSDYKVPIFEVPIMGTFTNSDVVAGAGRALVRSVRSGALLAGQNPSWEDAVDEAWVGGNTVTRDMYGRFCRRGR